MDPNKKLFFLAIYWLLFLFSFYSAFQIRSEIRGKREGTEINVNMFGRTFNIRSIDNANKLKYLFYTLSGLTLAVSIAMVYIIINYNYDIIEEKDLAHEEIKNIWGKTELED